MPAEPRESQRHATMSSLRATHTAHRVANEVHSTPTEELAEILQNKPEVIPSNGPPPVPDWAEDLRRPTAFEWLSYSLIWIAIAVLILLFIAAVIVLGRGAFGFRG